jgi:signal transduction histidine kinase
MMLCAAFLMSEHTDELLDQFEQLRKLAASSQQKYELERRHFSRILYDDLGQRLSVLKLDLDWLQARLGGMHADIPARIAQMEGLLASVIARTKNIAMTLRPPLLDDFGLIPAIEWLVDNFRKRAAVACDLEKRDVAICSGAPAESAVFRLVQEGLLNVERHAHASNVHIRLEQDSGRLAVTVEDDGIGASPGDIDKPGCYGLSAVRERVVILGGTIAVGNTDPSGFAIRASIPLDNLPLSSTPL